jgi:hypothetical protein
MSMPHEVVDQHRAAYNRGDLDGFVACCAADVTMVQPDGTVLATGIDELRSLYEEFFEDQPDVHAVVLNRIALGTVVIDEELVSGAVLDGEPSEMHAATLYEVIDGLITYVQIFA